MSLLTVDALSVSYRARRRRPDFLAVDDVSLQVDAGETLALVGESGSGKTTIGRAILGLTPVSGGRIVVADRELGEGPRAPGREAVHAVFQDPFGSLSPHLTIRDSLAEPLLSRSDADRRAVHAELARLVDRVGLPAGTLDRRPREFSGGQRQRIAIARALALRPSLIVCDEPVSALDLTTQKTVLDLLVDIQRETGVAYLFITHDLAVVRYISHRVSVLRNGRIVETGATDDVTADPHHPYTQELLLSSPLPDVDGQAERRRIRAARPFKEHE